MRFGLPRAPVMGWPLPAQSHTAQGRQSETLPSATCAAASQVAQPAQARTTRQDEVPMIPFRLSLVVGLCTLLAPLAPGESLQKKKGGKKDDPIHDPANAVANLDVHKDLRATLFASEPTLT